MRTRLIRAAGRGAGLHRPMGGVRCGRIDGLEGTA